MPETKTKSERALHLDSIRGAMLVMMGINHIPTGLQHLTNHPFGFVSAAEGFVFLAGVLVGRIYVARARTRGLAQALRAVFERIIKIYRVHLLSVLGVALWVWGFVALRGAPPEGSPALFFERPLGAIVAAATFLFRPGLIDILPLYCLLFMLLPGIILLLHRDQHRLLLALSFSVWALTARFDGTMPYVNGVVNTGAFNLGAWQFLFVVGVVCGDVYRDGRPLPKPPRVVLLGLVALALFFFAWRHHFTELGLTYDEREHVTNKNSLFPVRLLDVALVIYLVALAAERFPEAFSHRPLAFLGQHSLHVFAAHILAVYVILGLPAIFGEHAPLGGVLGPIFLLGVMFLAAFAHARLERAKV